jgi:hypothetical protein
MTSHFEDLNKVSVILRRFGLSERKIAEVQAMCVDDVDEKPGKYVYARMFPDTDESGEATVRTEWSEVRRGEIVAECGLEGLKVVERNSDNEVTSRCGTALYRAFRAGEGVL